MYACMPSIVLLPVFIYNSLAKIAFICHVYRLKVYVVQKEPQCFYLQFLGLKIIDFKNCFNSVVLPSNKDLDCKVSS